MLVYVLFEILYADIFQIIHKLKLPDNQTELQIKNEKTNKQKIRW